MANKGLVDEQVQQMAEKLSHFLATRISSDGRFSERTFYGEAFVSSAWNHRGEYPEQVKRALQHIETDSSVEVIGHREFIEYAKSSSGAYSLHHSVHFIGTIEKPTNWLLLRSYLYIRGKSSFMSFMGKVCVIVLVLLNQQKSGLLLDRRVGRMVLGDASAEYRSHQYHVFMVLVLLDIHAVWKSKLLWSRIQRAVTYALSIVTENGEIEKSGRGAQQIFGYAALITVLSILLNENENETYLHTLHSVLSYLGQFQEADGSFPLVLKVGDSKEEWESYNNLYDYLGFTLWALTRAHLSFSSLGTNVHESETSRASSGSSVASGYAERGNSA